MRLPRMTIRRLMIVIAVLAPFCLAGTWLYKAGKAVSDFYRPGGGLDLHHRIEQEYSAGESLLDQGEFTEAEGQFRMGLQSIESLRKLNGRSERTDGPFQLGLAKALAGQGRVREAEPLYVQALANYEKRAEGRDDLRLVDPLEGFAMFLRQMSRDAEAVELEERALTILDRHAARRRNEGNNAHAHAVLLEARADALRRSREK